MASLLLIIAPAPRVLELSYVSYLRVFVMNSQKSDSNWIVDRWKLLAFGALLVLVGVVLIVWGQNLPEKNFWRGLLEAIGKGLLAGALIELLFVVALVDSILELIRRTQGELAGKLLGRLAGFDKAGIDGVENQFNHKAYLEDLAIQRRLRRPFEVAVMQSWVFEPDHFTQIVSAALGGKKSTTCEMRLLFYHPDSSAGIERFVETHAGMSDASARDAMKSGLTELIDTILLDKNLAKAIDARTTTAGSSVGSSLQIRLYSQKGAMSLYRINDNCRVGWFPLAVWCIHSVHIRCRRVATLHSKPKESVASLACDQFDRYWNDAQPIIVSDGKYSIPKFAPLSRPGPSEMTHLQPSEAPIVQVTDLGKSKAGGSASMAAKEEPIEPS